jgi:hypothetical protein
LLQEVVEELGLQLFELEVEVAVAVVVVRHFQNLMNHQAKNNL